MTLRSVYGPGIEIPPMLLKGSTSYGNLPQTMDAASEQVHMIGEVILPGGPGTSKLLSNAGGKIHWRTSTVTWAAAGSTVVLSIQGVSTTTSPAQGDGTPLVSKSLVQGTDALASNTAQATALSTGSTTLSHGQLIAVCWNMSVRNGADAVSVQTNNTAYGAQGYNSPVVMLGTPTFVRQTTVPTFIIEFDDGTIGWFLNSAALLGSGSTVAFNSGTAVADEYGNFFTLPAPMRAVGISANINIASNAADFDLVLWQDPLGTPAPLEVISVDATQLGNVSGSTGVVNKAFQSNIILKPGIQYGISIRPTTANNVTTSYQDVSEASHWMLMGLEAASCYAMRTINNGSFSDYNGGTAMTRRLNLAILVDQFNDNAGRAASLLGI